uniref:Gamma-glutamylcyclotransferase a n=1 Tax=Sinocyclocheilus anshuiensis TaxID=1608454 RepID=A0A671KDS7_9TELE
LEYIVHTMVHKYGNHTDYRLNFGLSGNCTDCAWHGGVATIQESEGNEVWGVVWRIDNQNLPSLDRQEQVHEGVYSPIDIKVEIKKEVLLCRTYKMNNYRPCPPSPQYRKVLFTVHHKPVQPQIEQSTPLIKYQQVF